MSKPIGISRVRRKRVSNVKNQNKSVLKNKSNENKSISDLFSDFDLSDIKVDITFGNNSFKSTKSLLNSTDVSIGATNESNILHSFSTKSLVNVLDLKEIETNVNQRTSFRLSEDDSNIGKDITSMAPNNANKRKSSSLFDDLDLSDLNVDTSVTSFQSSRKVVRTEDKVMCCPDCPPNLSNKENDTNCDNTKRKSTDSAKSCDFAKPLQSFNNLRLSANESIQSTLDPNVNQRIIPLTSEIFDCYSNLDSFPQNIKQEKDSTIDKSILNSINPLVCIEKAVESTHNDVFPVVSKTTVSSINVNSLKVCESNSKDLSKKLRNIFKDFDLNDIKLNDSFNSFENVSKIFKKRHLSEKSLSKQEDYSLFFSIDSKSCNSYSIPEIARKTIVSNIFEDLDFSDIKFNESNASFRNSRTAYQSLDSTDNINNKTRIDWNDLNELFNQSFSDSQDFKTSSPKPKTSSPKISTNSSKLKSSSPKPESKSQEIDFSFEIDDEFFDSCIEKTEQELVSTENTKDSNVVKAENDSVDSFDSLHDISFSLRSDFATHNELTSQEFFSQLVEDQDNIGNQSFMGFRSGNGQPIHLSEEQISSAKLIFKDIEEWLLKEITESNTEFRECGKSVDTYSQKFVSDVGNSRQTIVSKLNNLLENESIESFAQIMSSTFDN